MQAKINFLLSTPLVTAGLFLASTASASMHYFSEMLTSDLMTGAPNYQILMNIDLDDYGNFSELVSNTATPGAGLGDSSISAGGDFSYTHSFGAADVATGIVSSHLNVLTASEGDSGSYSEITLDGDFWLNQSMSFQLSGGQVDASLFTSDGELMVNVTAYGSDLDLVWSSFHVNYEVDANRLAEGQTIIATGAGGGGDISAAIPEPGAATLFGAGILIVGSAIRRRSHES